MPAMAPHTWPAKWARSAKEIFFLGRNYSAQEAFEMGMVNAAVPHAELEEPALE